MDLDDETVDRIVELWMNSEERTDIPREEIIEARRDMHELFQKHDVTAFKTMEDDEDWVIHIYPRD